ncbi:MAG: hypothetical protein WD844_03260 [Thermoleophilaceae bacterium]
MSVRLTTKVRENPLRRAYAAYGQNSRVGKILEIHDETPGRIHVVLIRRAIGF